MLEPSLGAAPDADLVVETDAETYFLLSAGQLQPKDAVRAAERASRAIACSSSAASGC